MGINTEKKNSAKMENWLNTGIEESLFNVIFNELISYPSSLDNILSLSEIAQIIVKVLIPIIEDQYKDANNTEDEAFREEGRTHRDDGTIIGGKYDGKQEYDVAGWVPEE